MPATSPIGEGWAIQAVADSSGMANLRLLASAANYFRAREILLELQANFSNDFRPVRPQNIKQFVEEYIERRFNPGYANLITAINPALIADFDKVSPVWVRELQSKISGQVLFDEKTLEHYAVDGSIFRVKPWAVVLPGESHDLKEIVRWLNTLPSHPRLSLTARGKATDQAGGPLNDGIIFRFPDYLDKILEIGEDFIRVEPGALWRSVNEELAKSDRFVPCYPASADFSTIGGGVANNCSGEKTVKYGSMRDYVKQLKMVIADGSEMEVKMLNEAELQKKQSQPDFEGDIYRKMSDLLISNHNLLENHRPRVSKLSSGYWLWDVMSDRGLDLTKLICGAQGTLGMATEIRLKTIPRPAESGLLLATFSDLRSAGAAVLEILPLRPSALEMVDRFVLRASPLQFFEQPLPAVALLVEFDGDDLETIKDKIGIVKKELLAKAGLLREAYDHEEQEGLWQVRRAAALVAEAGPGKSLRDPGADRDQKNALPFIEDTVVPIARLADYLSRLYEILEKYQAEFAVWGHIGNGNFHLQPFLDVGDPADREKIFKITADVYRLALACGGMLSGEHNDGLMRSPYLKDHFGPDIYRLFETVKKIFDPKNIFNPGKKIGADLDSVKHRLREEYHIPVTKKPVIS